MHNGRWIGAISEIVHPPAASASRGLLLVKIDKQASVGQNTSSGNQSNYYIKTIGYMGANCESVLN